MEKIDPELAESPFIFPSESYIKDNNIKGFRALEPAGGPGVQRRVGKGGGQLMSMFSQELTLQGSKGFREAKGDLSLDSVTKEFGDFTAVDDLSLEVPARVVLRPARPVRLRQDDDAAHGRRARAADPRPDPHRRHRPHRVASLRATGQHGVPELRALPAPDHPRQRRLRAQAPRRPGRREAGGRRARAGADDPPRRAASPASSPVASSSAWRWPGPWSTSPRCCCSTSRSAPSTSSCAARCRSSSSGSRPRSG